MKTLSTFTYRKRRKARQQQRVVKTALLMLICCLTIALTVFHGSVALGESSIPQTIVVDNGDTLWTIAQRHLPKGRDVRSYIAQIRTINDLDTPVIYPGQTLELP